MEGGEEAVGREKKGAMGVGVFFVVFFVSCRVGCGYYKQK